VPAPTAATDPDVFRRDSRGRDETVDRSTAPILAVPEPVVEGPLYRSRELCAAAPINPLVTGDLCPVPSRVPSDKRISTGLVSNASIRASEPNRAGPSRVTDTDLVTALIHQNPQLLGQLLTRLNLQPASSTQQRQPSFGPSEPAGAQSLHSVGSSVPGF